MPPEFPSVIDIASQLISSTLDDETWRFAMKSGQFRISKDGTGGPEMTVSADGSVTMARGGKRNLPSIRPAILLL